LSPAESDYQTWKKPQHCFSLPELASRSPNVPLLDISENAGFVILQAVSHLGRGEVG
jgi:hypothetical protein